MTHQQRVQATRKQVIDAVDSVMADVVAKQKAPEAKKKPAAKKKPVAKKKPAGKKKPAAK